MKKVFAIAVVLILTLTACAAPAAAPSETTVNLRQDAAPDTITVSGKAGLESSPDIVKLNIGVESSGGTPGVARERNTEAVNATIAAVTALGIEESDIKTTYINLWNRYDNNGNISGYRMNTSLSVIVRDLEKAGEVLDAAVEAGSNELNGLEYMLSNQDELYNQALTDAVALARQKAEALAALEGKTVGAVVSITEASDAVATVRQANPDTSFEASADTVNEALKRTSVQPGRSSVYAEVSVVFLLQ